MFESDALGLFAYMEFQISFRPHHDICQHKHDSLSTQAMCHDVCAPAVCAAPVLDDRLQGKGGQVRGPLWVSTGEGFSPLGTLEFLMNIKQVIRQKLKNTQFYQKEVGGSRVCFQKSCSCSRASVSNSSFFLILPELQRPGFLNSSEDFSVFSFFILAEFDKLFWYHMR